MNNLSASIVNNSVAKHNCRQSGIFSFDVKYGTQTKNAIDDRLQALATVRGRHTTEGKNLNEAWNMLT